MSTKIWIGGAPAIAQTTKITVGGTPQLAAPSAPTLTLVSGTSNAAQVFVVATYTNGTGETTPSANSSQTPSGSQQVQVTSPSAQGTGTGAATGYNVYASTFSGGTYYLQNTSAPIAIGTPYTVPGTPASSGTTAPASNTAAGMTYTVTMGINGTKAVTYTSVGADTNATVATNFATVLSGSTYPEFQEETWTNPSSGIVLATAGT